MCRVKDRKLWFQCKETSKRCTTSEEKDARTYMIACVSSLEVLLFGVCSFNLPVAGAAQGCQKVKYL
jgi:hypothetical protein